VKLSRFPRVAGEDDESLSKRLGVRVEVLGEARAELARELDQRGLPPVEIGGRGLEIFDYLIRVPEPVYAALTELSNARQAQNTIAQVTPTALIRSLIVRALEHPEDVKVIHKIWRVWGQRYPGTERIGRQVCISVSRGAMQVFDEMAIVRQTTRSALVRSMVIDFLEDRVPGLKLVLSAKDMLNDPAVFRRLQNAETHG
jgi:hypothetical protein